MNERIRELARQAQKVVGHTDGGYTEIKVLDQEKFAELIVRQCLSMTHFEGRDRSASGIRERISTHFGVEL